MAKNGNGEGGITRHKKSGLYMARYTVQTPTGPKRKTLYGKTRREVALVASSKASVSTHSFPSGHRRSCSSSDDR